MEKPDNIYEEHSAELVPDEKRIYHYVDEVREWTRSFKTDEGWEEDTEETEKETIEINKLVLDRVALDKADEGEEVLDLSKQETVELLEEVNTSDLASELEEDPDEVMLTKIAEDKVYNMYFSSD